MIRKYSKISLLLPFVHHDCVHGVLTFFIATPWQYIDWPGWDTEQLFNLTNDPLEQTDEFQNPHYAEVLKEMKERHDVLREWVK